jgi:hypothetical protein
MLRAWVAQDGVAGGDELLQIVFCLMKFWLHDLCAVKGRRKKGGMRERKLKVRG